MQTRLIWNRIKYERKSCIAGCTFPPLTQQNPNLVVIEIGKKAPKIRRSPIRSRERLETKSKVSTAQCRLGRRGLVGSSRSKDHDDVTDEAPKRIGKQGKSRRNAWDDDWHNIIEQLSAIAREMDMALMKSKLATEEAMCCALRPFCGIAGQHDACVQARSREPSVKASASKLKKIFTNKQKQMRRRTVRALEHENEKTQCCLVDSFHGLGFKVPYVCDGPFRVLEDGSKMLKPFGYIIKAVPRIYSTGPGRWVVCKGEHCFALRRKGEGNTWSIDGADRKQVAARNLDTLTKGTKIFQVPSTRTSLCRNCYSDCGPCLTSS